MDRASPCTIHDLICCGNQDPDKTAIDSPGYQPLTYRDFRVQIHSVVKNLNARGFHRDDRIAIITPSGPETAVCIIAIMAGFTVVPLNPQYKEQEYGEIFSSVGIKAVIIQQGHETAAEAVADSRAIPVLELVPSGIAGKFDLVPGTSGSSVEAEFAIPSDIAYIKLTSGSTSVSKIVPVTQEQSAISKQRICRYQKITSDDRFLHILPYYHGAGVGAALLSPLIAGATVICTKDFIPSDFPYLLRTFHPTFFSAGPALNQGILRALKKVPSGELIEHSLRYIRSGSGFLPGDIRRELESILGVPVIEAYGMSEAGTIAINIPPKQGSVGIPIIDSLAIVNEKSEPLGPGNTGEIFIKDAALFCGYENAPEDNKAAFTDGWFRTGDMGYLDADGYLFLTGRKKELINKGGEKIPPEEIDSVLKGHPGVVDAMTFGIPDPVLGEDVAAMVVTADASITEQELRRYVLDRLVQFKIPRRIYFVDAIPKTPTGKPMRHEGTRRYS